MLDLSANRLQDLPDTLLDDFDLIKEVRLSENMLSLMPNVSFNGFRYSIKELYLLGEDMNYVPLNQIGIMRNLRTVGLSAITKTQGQITEELFEDFAPGLEELKLVRFFYTMHMLTYLDFAITLTIASNQFMQGFLQGHCTVLWILAMDFADLMGTEDLDCRKVESTRWLKHRLRATLEGQ